MYRGRAAASDVLRGSVLVNTRSLFGRASASARSRCCDEGRTAWKLSSCLARLATSTGKSVRGRADAVANPCYRDFGLAGPAAESYGLAAKSSVAFSNKDWMYLFIDFLLAAAFMATRL